MQGPFIHSPVIGLNFAPWFAHNKSLFLDDDEVIDVKIFSKNEIRKLMNRNKLQDMKTYVAIDRYFKLLT